MVTASSRLTVRLAAASVLSALAIASICAVALRGVVGVSGRTRTAVSREVDTLRDALAFDALMYQKGFVAYYMLTGDRRWLDKLADSRTAFDRWAAEVGPTFTGAEASILSDIRAEEAAYDRVRARAVQLFDSGHRADGTALVPASHVHLDRLRALAQEFGSVGRQRVENALIAAERSVRRLAWLLAAASFVGGVSSLIVGFLWARKIAKPMVELQVQVETAAERGRFRVRSGTPQGLADHVSALLERLEATDEALLEQRRRLVQSEKMSAVGELAAKLGHEMLNPLAGMKMTVQLLAAQARDDGHVRPQDVLGTTTEVEREIGRLDGLLRRLLAYSRPLKPVVEVSSVTKLIDAALQSLPQLRKPEAPSLSRSEDAELPPLEVDPMLFTQVLVNLIRNAAEASPGGHIQVRAFRHATDAGQFVRIDVVDDGPGIADDVLPKLFTPFLSTKPDGHGLGLALSRNIVVEHGGKLVAHNRDDARGAVFEVWLPLVR